MTTISQGQNIEKFCSYNTTLNSNKYSRRPKISAAKPRKGTGLHGGF